MRNKWKVSRYDFTLVDKGWPGGDPSGGKGMRGVPKMQDQTCWTNDDESTENQADGTSKTVLSSFCRILLAHSSLFRERETQKETICIPVHLLIVNCHTHLHCCVASLPFLLCSQLTLSVLGCGLRKRNSG